MKMATDMRFAHQLFDGNVRGYVSPISFSDYTGHGRHYLPAAARVIATTQSTTTQFLVSTIFFSPFFYFFFRQGGTSAETGGASSMESEKKALLTALLQHPCLPQLQECASMLNTRYRTYAEYARLASSAEWQTIPYVEVRYLSLRPSRLPLVYKESVIAAVFVEGSGRPKGEENKLFRVRRPL